MLAFSYSRVAICENLFKDRAHGLPTNPSPTVSLATQDMSNLGFEAVKDHETKAKYQESKWKEHAGFLVFLNRL